MNDDIVEILFYSTTSILQSAKSRAWRAYVFACLHACVLDVLEYLVLMSYMLVVLKYLT